MSNSSSWIRAETRWAIYIRDRFTCAWCGEHLGAGQLTLDHLFPRTSRYFGNGPKRVVTACHACNSRRRHAAVRDVLRYLPARERRYVTARLRRSLATPIDRAAGRALLLLLAKRDASLPPLPDGPGVVNGIIY